jgi:hypothetical protein
MILWLSLRRTTYRSFKVLKTLIADAFDRNGFPK